MPQGAETEEKAMNRIEKTFMPIWKPFTGKTTESMIGSLSDEEERTVALAAHYHFQARYEDAARESGHCLNSSCPEIRASALFVHSMTNVGLGNVQQVRADFAALMQAAQHPENEQMAAVYDAIRFLFSVLFHTDGKIEFVREEHSARLSEGTRLFLLYTVAHAMYLQKQYKEALGVAKSGLIMATGRFPSVCVYLNLVASMVASNLHDAEQAADFFHRAWQIAKPEDYIQPFVEHHGLLQGQIEKYVRDRNPREYNRIEEKIMAFSRGWIKIHNPDSVNKVTDRLSPYEFSLAMMAVKGKSNQEIADYMHISINTVKFHLSNIYQKVQVSNRKELEKYLNR